MKNWDWNFAKNSVTFGKYANMQNKIELSRNLSLLTNTDITYTHAITINRLTAHYCVVDINGYRFFATVNRQECVQLSVNREYVRMVWSLADYLLTWAPVCRHRRRRHYAVIWYPVITSQTRMQFLGANGRGRAVVTPVSNHYRRRRCHQPRVAPLMPAAG